jgi:hypothetical protein
MRPSLKMKALRQRRNRLTNLTGNQVSRHQNSCYANCNSNSNNYSSNNRERRKAFLHRRIPTHSRISRSSNKVGGGVPECLKGRELKCAS